MVAGQPLAGALGLLSIAGGPTLDPIVRDYRTRVIAAGSTVSSATLRAADVLVRGLRAGGYLGSAADGSGGLLLRIGLCAGDSLVAARVPLVALIGSALDGTGTTGTFTYAENTGIDIAIGTSGTDGNRGLTTGWHVSDGPLSLLDITLATYCYTPAGTGGEVVHIGTDTLAGDIRIGGFNTQTTRYCTMTATGDPSGASVNLTTGDLRGKTAYIGMTSTSDGLTRGAVRSDGQTAYTTVTAGTAHSAATAPSQQIALGHSRFDSIHTQIRGYAIGHGMTTAKLTTLGDLFNAFNVALGRGVA